MTLITALTYALKRSLWLIDYRRRQEPRKNQRATAVQHQHHYFRFTPKNTRFVNDVHDTPLIAGTQLPLLHNKIRPSLVMKDGS